MTIDHSLCAAIVKLEPLQVMPVAPAEANICFHTAVVKLKLLQG